MSMLGHDGWKLVVDYAPREVQGDYDPEFEFPNDDASRLVAKAVTSYYELDDEIEFLDDGTQVTIHSDTIDGFGKLCDWIVFHTMPIRMTLYAVAQREPIPTVGEM